jgi:hypothetical protein
MLYVQRKAGTHRVRGYLLPSTRIAVASLPSGLVARKVATSHGGYAPIAFYQRDRLLMVQLSARRRPGRYSRLRSIPKSGWIKRTARIRRGEKVLWWSGRKVVKGRVVRAKTKACGAVTGSFEATVKGRKPNASVMVFNGKGKAVGVRLCTLKGPKGRQRQVIAPLSALLTELQRFLKVQAGFATRNGGNDQTAMIYMSLSGVSAKVECLRVADPHLLWCSVPKEKKVQSLRRARAGRHHPFVVSEWLQTGGIVLVRVAYLDGERLPTGFVRVAGWKGGAEKGKGKRARKDEEKGKRKRKGARGEKRKARARAKAKAKAAAKAAAKDLFLTDGTGYYYVERRGGPTTPNDGDLEAMAAGAFALIGSGGVFEALRVGSVKAHSGEVVQRLAEKKRLEAVYASLERRYRKDGVEMFEGVEERLRKLRTALVRSLVRVRRERRGKRERIGLLVGPRKVLVPWSARPHDDELTVRAYAAKKAKPVSVVTISQGLQRPHVGLNRLLNATGVAVLKRKPRNVEPLRLSSPVPRKSKEEKKKARWIYVLAERKGKLTILPIYHDPHRGNLVAVRKGAELGGWVSVGGIPAFTRCGAQGCVPFRIIARRSLRPYPRREPWHAAPEGYELVYLTGLAFRPPKMVSRTVLRKRRDRRRRLIERRRRRRRARRRRQRRRKRPWRAPKGWYWQLEAASGFALSTLTRETTEEGDILAETEQHAAVPFYIIPRIMLSRPRAKGWQLFMGHHFSLEIPFKLEYLAPLDDRADHGFRFRMGIAPGTEIDLSKSWQLSSGLGILLPEMGFSVVKQRGRKTVGGVYFEIPRVHATCWVSPETGFRMRMAAHVGFRFVDDVYGGVDRVRNDIGFHFTIGSVFR